MGQGQDLGKGLGQSGGRTAVLIAGPTASGKSALALALARDTGGIIVNADSMQVYADLRIITARPTPDEEDIAPHRLFGTVDGAENFSVGRWIDAISHVLADTGALPIIVGGTGLYFKALTHGLSALPPVPPEVREAVRRETDGLPPSDLHARLARLDPRTAARLRPTDPQRLQRALEIFAATGRPLADFHDEGRDTARLAGWRTHAVFLDVDRSALRARIDARFDAMMAGGAHGEVARLAERALDPALPVMRAHGVPGLIAALRGEMGVDAAIARGKADTRAYAKRQVTWFRTQLPGFLPMTPDAAAAHLRRTL